MSMIRGGWHGHGIAKGYHRNADGSGNCNDCGAEVKAGENEKEKLQNTRCDSQRRVTTPLPTIRTGWSNTSI